MLGGMHRFLLPAASCPLLLMIACSADAEANAEEPAAEPEAIPRERLLRMMSPAEVDALAGPRGVRVREPEAYPGYTLLAPLNSTKVHLVDLDGAEVHTWDAGMGPGEWCRLLDDGTLLHLGRKEETERFRGGGIGGIQRRLAPDGTVLWRHEIADGEAHQHHDLEPLPNGNLLVIQWEHKSAAEAVARGAHPDSVGGAGLWPDAVLELEPTGAEGARVVWEWHAWDHLVQDVDPAKPGYGAIAEHPGRIDVNATYEPPDEVTEAERREAEERERQMAAMGYGGGAEDPEPPADAPSPPKEDPRDRSGDWLHTNAVAYHAELDLIALSSPELCEVFVIDHSTTTAEAATSSGGRFGRGGDLLWRWGNPAMHGAAGEKRLFYQHDPTWLGGADDLRLLVFNNGGRRPDGAGGSGWSEVLELELPFDAERGFTSLGPAKPGWTYSDPATFFSAFVSGAQRLPNGNTLVCSGAGGRIFEVTRDGRVVWDYLNPHGGDLQPAEHAGKAPPLALFRATRLAPDHPGVRALLGD
jgi:hypothetical protein